MPAPVVEHGFEVSGPTGLRPLNPHISFQFFDVTIGYLLTWTGTDWRPSSVGYGTTATRPAATDVPPGSQFYNQDSGELQFSDGAAWLPLTVPDEQSSSTSSSSTSSPSSESSSSPSSSSTSSSSTSSST